MGETVRTLVYKIGDVCKNIEEWKGQERNMTSYPQPAYLRRISTWNFALGKLRCSLQLEPLTYGNVERGVEF